MNDKKEMVNIILYIKHAVSFLNICGVKGNEYLINDISDSLFSVSSECANAKQEVNAVVNELHKVREKSSLSDGDMDRISDLFVRIIIKISDGIEGVKKRQEYPDNMLDKEFSELISRLENESVEELLQSSARNAQLLKKKDRAYYEDLKLWYKNWYGIASFDSREQTYIAYFGNLYSYLKENIDRLEKLYESLCDYRSKYTLKLIIQNWLTFYPNFRNQGLEKTFPHYYDLDLIKCGPGEVFVDCGAFNGDSILSFIKSYGTSYKSIYAYEITEKTFEELKSNVAAYNNIYLRKMGIADKEMTMNMLEVGVPDGNRLNSRGKITVPVTYLDKDIKEDITFIKMDIEGAEAAALIGAQNHIKRSKPKLAISLYHKHSDLIELPELIRKINLGYNYYLRHTGGVVPYPTEYILIAI